MKLTRLVTVVASCTLMLGLVGCSNGNSKPSTNDKGSSNAPVRVWFMEGSVSDAAQKYLTETFEKENPGQKLKVEVQPWKNIKSKLQTALASDDQSPDLVEFSASPDPLIVAGAFQDISDLYEPLGGKDFIPAFAKGGIWEGKRYSLPLYGGVRGVFYRKDLFKKAGINKPETLTELKDAAIKLQASNPEKKPNFSGMYLAGIDLHALESYMYALGGEYAKQEGDKWVGQLSAAPAQKALKDMQEIFRKGTRYALDSQAGQKQFQNYFNNGTAGMLIATGNIGEKIDKKLWDEDKVGVMPLPSETPGKIGSSYAGGSNIGLATKALNPKGARAALKIIFSEKFQTMMAESGWIPGNLKYADKVAGPLGKYSKEIMKNANIGPETPNMGVFFRNNALKDFWARIAKLEDPVKVAGELDKQFNTVLNK